MNEGTLYILGTDWTAAGATEEQAAIIAAGDFYVATAPRPLYGSHVWLPEPGGVERHVSMEWRGGNGHGFHFAASDRSYHAVISAGASIAGLWRRAGARLVELVSADDVRRRVVAAIEEHIAETIAPEPSVIRAALRAEMLDHFDDYCDQLGLPRLPA